MLGCTTETMPADGASVPSMDGGGRAVAQVLHPDVVPIDGHYVPVPGTCGFDAPAFCETFELGPQSGGRAGELDPTRWSVGRTGGATHLGGGFPTGGGFAFPVDAARMPQCRDNLSGNMVVPDG